MTVPINRKLYVLCQTYCMRNVHIRAAHNVDTCFSTTDTNIGDLPISLRKPHILPSTNIYRLLIVPATGQGPVSYLGKREKYQERLQLRDNYISYMHIQGKQCAYQTSHQASV
ncbi:hypothetical protein SNK03_13582 [Fusarium graminearum]